jgi:hypothetical protein
VGLYVGKRKTLDARHTGNSSDLIEDEVLRLLRRQAHLPPAEAASIRKRGMSANGDPELARQVKSPAKDGGIASVEPGGDVRGRDAPHHPRVVADRVRAERFTDVCVEIDAHRSRTERSVYKQRSIAYAMPPCPIGLAPPAIHGDVP